MSKSTRTTARSEPWPEIQPYLLGAADRIGELATSNQLTPFVQPSDATFGGIRRLGNMGRNNQVTAGALQNYDQFMNRNTNVAAPQLRGDLGPVQLSGDQFGMDRISDFVMSKTLPQVAGMFGQGGFANSTMAQSTAADAVTNALTPFAQQQFNLDRGRMDENTYYNAAQGERMLGRSDQNAWMRADLMGQNRDRGLQRDLSGLGLAPTLSGMQYADIDAIRQAGAARDAIGAQRAGVDSMNAQQAANIFAGLGGLGGVQTGTQPGPGLLGTLGGLGQVGVQGALAANLLGAGSGAAAGGAFGAGAAAASPALAGSIGGISSLLPALSFCDRRLKTNIEPTPYRTTKTGSPVYTFRYLWDEPHVRRIGPMAQEVPAHARVTLPSGFLAVDMGAL